MDQVSQEELEKLAALQVRKRQHQLARQALMKSLQNQFVVSGFTRGQVVGSVDEENVRIAHDFILNGVKVVAMRETTAMMSTCTIMPPEERLTVGQGYWTQAEVRSAQTAEKRAALEQELATLTGQLSPSTPRVAAAAPAVPVVAKKSPTPQQLDSLAKARAARAANRAAKVG